MHSALGRSHPMHSALGRSRPMRPSLRRNSSPVWGGPLFRRNPQSPVWGGPLFRHNPQAPFYRRNLLSQSRRAELQEKSPGNFRRPTLAVTKDYLDDWAKQGIKSSDDWDESDASSTWDLRAKTNETSPALERALEMNRYDEAMHYWSPAQQAMDLHSSDPESYPEPRLTQPVLGSLEAASADDRDFGDYEPIDKDQAYNYLYQFLHRNALRRAEGGQIDDPRVAPYKWRYRDAVLTVGPEKATALASRTFATVSKRVPSYYLPENLYDDLGEIFPEAEAAGEASRRMRRRNPMSNFTCHSCGM